MSSGTLGVVLIVPSAVERITEFPPSATQLLRQLPLRKGEPYDVREFLRKDPDLFDEVAAKVIARFSIGEEASNAEEIISRMDMDQLAEIALTILVRSYMREALKMSAVHGYWRYTLACAITCRELSRINSVNFALAYSAGLLHDIGRLALIAAYPEKYGNLLLLVQRMMNARESINVAEYERTLFGLDRFSIAEWLAERWELPKTITPVVGKFEDTSGRESQELIKTVHAGSAVAYSLGYGLLTAAPRRPIESILKPPLLPGPVRSTGGGHQPLRMVLDLPDLIEEQLLRYSVL